MTSVVRQKDALSAAPRESNPLDQLSKLILRKMCFPRDRTDATVLDSYWLVIASIKDKIYQGIKGEAKKKKNQTKQNKKRTGELIKHMATEKGSHVLSVLSWNWQVCDLPQMASPNTMTIRA